MDGFRIEFAGAAKPARTCAVLLGLALLAGCSTPSPVASKPPFSQADAADFINRSYSDEVSYVLRPVTMEGEFQSVCDRDRVLTLARQQRGRSLAVVLLPRYDTPEEEQAVKARWAKDLTALDYRRIVFLRSDSSLRVNGAPILERPASPHRRCGPLTLLSASRLRPASAGWGEYPIEPAAGQGHGGTAPRLWTTYPPDLIRQPARREPPLCCWAWRCWAAARRSRSSPASPRLPRRSRLISSRVTTPTMPST